MVLNLTHSTKSLIVSPLLQWWWFWGNFWTVMHKCFAVPVGRPVSADHWLQSMQGHMGKSEKDTTIIYYLYYNWLRISTAGQYLKKGFHWDMHFTFFCGFWSHLFHNAKFSAVKDFPHNGTGLFSNSEGRGHEPHQHSRTCRHCWSTEQTVVSGHILKKTFTGNASLPLAICLKTSKSPSSVNNT